MAAQDDAARFDAALEQAHLSLDDRDKRGALRVFLSLEKSAALVKAKADAPR